jgi:hypothetical protein
MQSKSSRLTLPTERMQGASADGAAQLWGRMLDGLDVEAKWGQRAQTPGYVRRRPASIVPSGPCECLAAMTQTARRIIRLCYD